MSSFFPFLFTKLYTYLTEEGPYKWKHPLFFLSKLTEAESSMWTYSFVQQPQLKKTGGSHNLLADAEEGSMILQQDRHMHMATRGSHCSLRENTPQRLNPKPIRKGL